MSPDSVVPRVSTVSSEAGSSNSTSEMEVQQPEKYADTLEHIFSEEYSSDSVFIQLFISSFWFYSSFFSFPSLFICSSKSVRFPGSDDKSSLRNVDEVPRFPFHARSGSSIVNSNPMIEKETPQNVLVHIS